MNIQGGTIANNNGNQLENFVENILKRKEYTFIQKQQFKPAVYLEQPIYTKQFFLGESIYATNLYCDFVLYHPEKHRDCLVIECKWQQTGGSVDEKFPYLVINIKTVYRYQTILLLDGQGYKKGSEKWLKSQRDNKLLHVFNMQEFQKWSNKNNL